MLKTNNLITMLLVKMCKSSFLNDVKTLLTDSSDIVRNYGTVGNGLAHGTVELTCYNFDEEFQVRIPPTSPTPPSQGVCCILANSLSGTTDVGPLGPEHRELQVGRVQNGGQGCAA